MNEALHHVAALNWLTAERKIAYHRGRTHLLPLFDAAIDSVRAELRAAAQLARLPAAKRADYAQTAPMHGGPAVTLLHNGFSPTLAATQLLAKA